MEGSIVSAHIANVFDRVDYTPQLAEPDRCAIAIGNNQGGIFRGVEKLIRSIHLPPVNRAVERSFRLVCVGITKSCRYVVQADVHSVDYVWVDLDAHRRLRTPENVNLAHTCYLRNLLRKHRIRNVIEVRLVISYPKHAEYVGTGDPEDARSFRCE